MATYQFTCGRIDSCAECPFLSGFECSDLSTQHFCELDELDVDDLSVKPSNCQLKEV